MFWVQAPRLHAGAGEGPSKNLRVIDFSFFGSSPAAACRSGRGKASDLQKSEKLMDDQAPRLHAGVGEVKTQIFQKTHGFVLDQAPRLHAGVGEVKDQICRSPKNSCSYGVDDDDAGCDTVSSPAFSRRTRSAISSITWPVVYSMTSPVFVMPHSMLRCFLLMDFKLDAAT